jgi:hypothetical protein
VKQFLIREGIIGKDLAVKMTKQCIDIMSTYLYLICIEKEPNLLYVDEPIVIVGDLHG